MKKDGRPRYLLPDISAPINTRCIVLHVPDDLQHLSAFWGHLDLLGHAYVWGNDPDHRALLVAEYWKGIVQNAWESYTNGTGECADMFDCDGVATCIDGNSNTDRALYDWLLRTLRLHVGTGDDIDILITGGGTVVFNPDNVVPISNDAILPADLTAGCDPDNLFAFCRQFVQWSNRSISDLYELIELITNTVEAIAEVIDNIPVLSQFAVVVSTAMDLLEWLVSSVTEAYLAQYTTELENEYACDLFCLARSGDCGLSFTDVANYFANRVGLNITTIDDFNHMIEGLYNPSANGTEYCDISFALFTSVLAFGGNWAGLSLSTVRGLARAMYNDADADWIELCDECPPAAWTATFDFTLSACGMITPVFGKYTPGVGLQTTNTYYEGTYNTRCLARPDAEFLEPFVTTSVEYTFPVFQYGQGFNGEWASVFWSQYTTPVTVRPAGAGTYTKIFSGLSVVDSWRNFLDFRTSHGWEYGGSATLSRARISGQGTIPAWIASNATEWDYN